jgi:hypothetical protein
MKRSNFGELPAGRPLNAVALHYAVLCAECDVVSDSPHDICMVCGSRSLVNICKILGGNPMRFGVEMLGDDLFTARDSAAATHLFAQPVMIFSHSWGYYSFGV